MLKITNRLFLIVARGSFLLACAAFAIQAQQPPPGERVRRPTSQPTPTPQAPLKRGRVIGGARAQLAKGIYGAIRWKKEYGLPSTDGGQTPNKALNCTAFRVQATVQEGAPGTFGSPRNVGYFGTQNEPTEENGYYVCSYSLADQSGDFPHNRIITVSSFLGPFASAELNQALITGTWFGPSGPKPPPGYQRVVIGGRSITLTDSAPRVTVDFEMLYRPVPAPPR
jgi:hypothetical protein